MAELDPRYFAVQDGLNGIRAEAGLDSLDPVSQIIIERIGKAQADGVDLTVGDLSNTGLGSSVTVQGRLKQLAKWGWIKAKADPADRRRKRLLLTARAIRMFNKASRHLADGSSSARPAARKN